MTRQVLVHCDRCGAAIEVREGERPSASPCPRCETPRPLDPDGAFDDAGRVVRCLGCGGDRFYVQKDFSRITGCLAFALTIAASIAVAAIWGWLWWMLVLMGAALLDAALYAVLKPVTVCYRCKALYRGMPAHPEHGAFELRVAEGYDAASPHLD